LNCAASAASQCLQCLERRPANDILHRQQQLIPSKHVGQQALNLLCTRVVSPDISPEPSANLSVVSQCDVLNTFSPLSDGAFPMHQLGLQTSRLCYHQRMAAFVRTAEALAMLADGQPGVEIDCATAGDSAEIRQSSSDKPSDSIAMDGSVLVLKTGEVKASVGSNPTPSASSARPPQGPGRETRKSQDFSPCAHAPQG